MSTDKLLHTQQHITFLLWNAANRGTDPGTHLNPQEVPNIQYDSIKQLVTCSHVKIDRLTTL